MTDRATEPARNIRTTVDRIFRPDPTVARLNSIFTAAVPIAIATLREVAANPAAAELTRRRAARTLAAYRIPLTADDGR